jgi:5S rRNA maturation endonuclease (ribonuclease M5)
MYDRDDILRRTDLAALLDDLSPGPPTRLGKTARWRCIDPAHQDNKPSVTMFTDHRGIQRWKCWSGGHNGTAIDAILTAKGGTIAEALADLQQRTGNLERTVRARVAPVPYGPVELDPVVLEYVEACQRILWKPAGRHVLDYLVTERGLDPSVLEANHVGADLGPDVMSRRKGLPRGGVAAVLPTHAIDGQITYAQARYLQPNTGRPKYDNPAGRLGTNPRIGWVIKPTGLSTSVLVVCEGVIDALSATGAGFASVALLSAIYANQQVARSISDRAEDRKVLLGLDSDESGRTASQQLADAFEALNCRHEILEMPIGHDLNAELLESSGPTSAILRRIPAFGPPPTLSTSCSNRRHAMHSDGRSRPE